MKIGLLLRRFLTPPPVVSLLGYFRYRAFISPRAEVDLSSQLSLGEKVRISSFTKIKAAHGPIRIGERTSVATGGFISAGDKGTFIGSDCLIGPNCAIVSGTFRYTDLNVPFEKQGRASKGTRIGNNVLIGAGTVVVDGAQIGNGVVINANSVVAGKIPNNAVIQGNPAKVIFVRR